MCLHSHRYSIGIQQIILSMSSEVNFILFMFSEVNIRMFQVSRMKNWPLKQAHPSGQKIPAQSDRYNWIKLDMCILCSGILRVKRHCLQCHSHSSLLGILYIYQRSKKIAGRRLVSLYFTWQMCPAASEHPNPVGVQLFGREFSFTLWKLLIMICFCRRRWL